LYDIIIFGGGLSGLTLAHELCKKNFKILIIEKDNQLGGMARSNIEQNYIPSEHSWRGYAPFYKNTFQIMKEIPYFDTTVFSNLSVPIEFFLLYDLEKDYKLTLNLKDKIILVYLGIIYSFAGDRRAYYYSYNIKNVLKKYLSTDGYNYIINFITGPGYGMNKNEISMGHLFHFPVISYLNKNEYTHSHTGKGTDKGEGKGTYTHKSSDGWHVMNGPTSDVWIKPWINYLKNNGVEILNNAEKLDNTQLKKEIIHQILRSKSFQKLIYDHNGFYINKDDVKFVEIWYEWEFINNKQEQVNKKWVNNINNEQFRPPQITSYNNLFLSGAHTKTTINIWSMEGAIESGKITANYILNKYNKPLSKHYKHTGPFYIKLIQYIDNILYKAHLPNIINLFIIFIVIFIVLIINIIL